MFKGRMAYSVLCRCLRIAASVAPDVKARLVSGPGVRRMSSKSSAPLEPAAFYAGLQNIGVDFFCGVPDSLLKDFCAYVTSNAKKENHVITANEGCAVGLAAGYHLATGGHALVYLQNSGLGNTVNPIMSLATSGVYSVPMLLLVGWRGEPGVKDEPQHVTQGQITPSLLDVMGVPHEVVPQSNEAASEVLQKAKKHLEEKKTPFCLLVKSKTFSPYKLKNEPYDGITLSREEALRSVVGSLGDRDIIVSTTGMLSRELFELRAAQGQGHSRDFLTVGSMGHASSIALGIALSKPGRQVICLDGDGAALMHMGAMATIGQRAPPNFKHVVFNNGAHDSVGGQPTEARNWQSFSLCGVARACGYGAAVSVRDKAALEAAVAALRGAPGPRLLEIQVVLGARADLGRPTRTPLQNKTDFMEFVAKDS